MAAPLESLPCPARSGREGRRSPHAADPLGQDTREGHAAAALPAPPAASRARTEVPLTGVRTPWPFPGFTGRAGAYTGHGAAEAAGPSCSLQPSSAGVGSPRRTKLRRGAAA